MSLTVNGFAIGPLSVLAVPLIPSGKHLFCFDYVVVLEHRMNNVRILSVGSPSRVEVVRLNDDQASGHISVFVKQGPTVPDAASSVAMASVRLAAAVCASEVEPRCASA